MGSFGPGTSSLKRQHDGYDAEAKPTKIDQKTSLVRDKLSEIKDSDKHKRKIIKLVTPGKNEHVIVLVYWFDLYHFVLRIISNTNIFDSENCGP